MNKPNFDYVKENALLSISSVLSHWLPNGRFNGKEYICLNPKRADKSLGSFSINTDTGVWKDFANDIAGGDLIALVAYLDDLTQGEACKKLSAFLNIDQHQASPPELQPITKPAKPSWHPVFPVPLEAEKSCPNSHYRLGSPSNIWEYLDQDGNLLMKILRFDNAKGGASAKEIRPLTYCYSNHDKSKREWRWQQPKSKRPLYGLDLLTTNADKTLLITEGEKAADAARLLLPEMICLTWPGGSQAISKADFEPIRGSKVILWPDNDNAGQDCMEKLATVLLKLQCKVSIINLRALGDKWPSKADAADAIKNGVTASKLKVLFNSNEFIRDLSNQGPQKNDETQNTPSSQFTVNDRGVFFKAYDADDEAKPIKICSRLDIVALTRDKSGSNWGTLVRFTDPDNVTKEWNLPSELLAAEGGSEVLKQLYKLGLKAEAGQQPRRRLIQYLQTAKTSFRYTLVNKLGWHGKAYLLPRKTFGTPEFPLYFHSDTPHLNKISQRGTIREWQENIASICSKNPRLMFAVSAAFAGPLLDIIGMETTGFHFCGDSSQGKTTLLKIAASVYGAPDYMRTWRSTDNALESIAAAHSDRLLILDEIGQCDPRIVGDISYLLGNGLGKARATDKGNPLEWRLIFISSGEKTLAQHMAEAGKKPKAGQEIRLLAIPSDAGNNLGIFNDLHNYSSGAFLSGKLSENCSLYHGEPFYHFMEKLMELDHESLTREIRSKFAEFSHSLPEDSCGQVRRASEKFILVGIAGELVSKMGITGWDPNDPIEASKILFNDWLNLRGGTGNLEDQQAISQVKVLLEQNLESNFTRWDRDDSTADEHGPRTAKRWGFRKTIEDSNVLGETSETENSSPKCSETTLYIFPESFNTEICNGFNPRKVKQLLFEMGAIEKDSGGKFTKPVRLPGMGRPLQRVLVIRPHLIETSD